jgi:hypothetical protein
MVYQKIAFILVDVAKFSLKTNLVRAIVVMRVYAMNVGLVLSMRRMERITVIYATIVSGKMTNLSGIMMDKEIQNATRE